MELGERERKISDGRCKISDVGTILGFGDFGISGFLDLLGKNADGADGGD